jgi:hypothetical protein
MGMTWDDPYRYQGFLNLSFTMDPFESLVKPTGPFSEKCIQMHKIK